MSLYEAYGAAESVLGWKAEVIARFRDILERRLAPLGEEVENALRRFERTLGSALSRDKFRSSVETLRSWLRKRRDAKGRNLYDEELEILFQQIIACGRDEGIENYSRHLFVVDVKL